MCRPLSPPRCGMPHAEMLSGKGRCPPSPSMELQTPILLLGAKRLDRGHDAAAYTLARAPCIATRALASTRTNLTWASLRSDFRLRVAYQAASRASPAPCWLAATSAPLSSRSLASPLPLHTASRVSRLRLEQASSGAEPPCSCAARPFLLRFRRPLQGCCAATRPRCSSSSAATDWRSSTGAQGPALACCKRRRRATTAASTAAALSSLSPWPDKPCAGRLRLCCGAGLPLLAGLHAEARAGRVLASHTACALRAAPSSSPGAWC
jgi:hypothetical protein